jgi:hypothetical protein
MANVSSPYHLTKQNNVTIVDNSTTTTTPPTTTTPTTYHLLLVQDKRHQKLASDFRNNKVGFSTWTQTTVDEARWDYLSKSRGADGFIFLQTKGKMPKLAEKVNVAIDEWVGVLSVSNLLINLTKISSFMSSLSPFTRKACSRSTLWLGTR